MALLTAEQIDELRRIIRDSSAAVAISTTGMEVSDQELERLVKEGYFDPKESENLVMDSFEYGRLMEKLPGLEQMTYQQFRDYLEKNPVELSQRERLAYELAVNRAGQFCVGLGSRYSGELGQNVVQLDERLAQQFLEGTRDETGYSIARRDNIGQLTTHLRQMSEDWARDWQRIAATESQFAHQQGKFEQVVSEFGEGAMMAKVPEPTACKDCKRLYLGEDGLPIIRPASWWHGQGVSNVGLKRAEWRPVLGAVHSWCMCQLVRVPEGMEFNEQWDLMPKGMKKSNSPDQVVKAVPYIGPRGGRWADPQHTIPWKEDKEAFREHIATLKLERQERLAAHRKQIRIGGEYKTDHGYIAVFPDPSHPGKVRTQSFDYYGFSGHRTYDDLDALAADTLPHKGQWESATGIMDKLSLTEEWSEGMARTTVIQALNSLGYYRQHDDVELINQHVERHGFVSAADALRGWSEDSKNLSEKTRELLAKAANNWDLAKSRKLHYRTTWNGLPISIENRKGSKRYWYDKETETHGETLMHYPYGYIRMTEAVDGDHVDVFIGPNEEAKFVYVVHQRKAPGFTEYDEDKVMLGFDTRFEAKRAYLQHYDSPRFFGDMMAIPTAKFVERCMTGKYRDGKRIAKGIYSAEGLHLTSAGNRPPVGTMGNVGKPARTPGENHWAPQLQEDHPASPKKRKRKPKRKKTKEPEERKERMQAATDPRYRDWARPIPDYRQEGEIDRDAERNMEWLAAEQERRSKRGNHRRLTIPVKSMR